VQLFYRFFGTVSNEQKSIYENNKKVTQMDELFNQNRLKSIRLLKFFVIPRQIEVGYRNHTGLDEYVHLQLLFEWHIQVHCDGCNH